jgi:two-component system, OmpR family, response regulator
VMREADELAALKALRATPAAAATPVIFVSARPPESADHFGLGVIGTIPKPFDPQSLPDRVAALWEQHHASR